MSPTRQPEPRGFVPGLEVPLVQAPIGSATCPELAAAVSNAGALGMLALSWRTPDQVRDVVAATQRLTRRAFGVNLVLAWPQEERLGICLEAGVRVVSTFWGDPGPLHAAIHDAGGLHFHSVGSADEAMRARDAGVDVLVAQGAEAGGHVRGTVPLGALLPAVLEVAGSIPVVAAGGIATGAQGAHWMGLGASGVWVGTRFLCSEEADVHPAYQKAILDAREGDTLLGEVFDKGWEGAPHRVLRNSTVRRWLEAGSPRPGARPGEKDTVAWRHDGAPVERYSDVIPTRGTTGQVEALALYAGTSAAAVTGVVPAARIVDEFREKS